MWTKIDLDSSCNWNKMVRTWFKNKPSLHVNIYDVHRCAVHVLYKQNTNMNLTSGNVNH